MELKLFNTLTKQEEVICPSHEGGPLLMYTCGPTIYNFAHIGNFRTYVAQDILRRTLLHFGMKVKQVMNLTDVDDKTIRGALEKKIPLKEFTEPFGQAFLEDCKTLHILPAEHYPKATDYIPEMIRLIQTLLDNKVAYRNAQGSIYFSIRHFPSYGKLSHLCMEDLKPNASGDNEADEYEKQNLSDFVLWKIYDPERDGHIFWESPFGKGRPGWHIECSAMAMKLLGETIDLHCGGVDLTFPHHENEIAQSEGCTGKTFVRHWFHVEHLLVDHKKMSKSLNNFYTLRDLLKMGFSGKEVRYLLLSGHYRVQLNFTMASLQAARASLQRISDVLDRLKKVQIPGDDLSSDLLETSRKAFDEALSNDLNMAKALSVVFEWVRSCNALMDAGKMQVGMAQKMLALFARWDTVLGLFSEDDKEEIPAELHDLLILREEARKTKQFAKSDAIRQQILDRGYLIEDTASGARLKRK